MTTNGNVMNNDGLDKLVSKILQPDFKGAQPYKDPISWEDLGNYDEITPDGKASMEEQLIEQETKQEMWTAIKNLPEADRDILMRVVVDRQSLDQVGVIYGVQKAAISKRLARILTHLKSEISLETF